MNKIISKILLLTLIFSMVPMQATGFSALWNKHASPVLTSLYVLGAAALTYACYKDSIKQVKELEEEGLRIDQEKERLKSANSQQSKATRSKAEKKLNELYSEHQRKMNWCYERPVSVGAVLLVAGGLMKFYHVYRNVL